ncbi:histidine kinase [Neobacillus niacini]|uniref:sensor histidine kinase n=1 Tax=Neobacillus niacini TaxID=86668 RepID=UPI00052FA7D5|nr:ATP-binding protein [Neobacillus niacini]KGM44804.1 histidine kinase [Neobacillus niacini]MEC1522597.1 histidine kinase [Neobacillus niacini]
MSYRLIQMLTVILPTILIGGFEFFRHDYLLGHLSMETGNVFITILTFVLSLLFSFWVFHIIRIKNDQLAEEQAKRAVYEERERLAHELHDGIAQSLFFLNVKLKQGDLVAASRAVSTIDHHVRQAIFNLRSTPEEDGSMNSRVAKWMSEWSSFTGIDVEIDLEIPNGIFTVKEEVQIFAIIQEAFANIRKHSMSTQAHIDFKDTQDYWQLRIWDNGCGMDLALVSDRKYGISMMKERARQVGADFQINNSELGGTEIIVTKERKK